MFRDRVEQLREAVAGLRRRADDWGLPRPVLSERQHLREVTRRLVRAGPIGLVHDEHVGDLQHTGLDRLDVVAEAGHGHEAHGIGDADHVDLLLSDADGLDDHHVGPERVEDVHDTNGGAREPACVPPARHRADEDPLVEEALAHPDAVAEDRATAEGTRRIDRDDGNVRRALAERGRETVHERRLPAAWRAGDADDLRSAGLRIKRSHRAGCPGLVVLDDGQQSRDGVLVASARAMTMRWTSLVPSPISIRRTSRRCRSIGKSRRYPYPPSTWSDESAALVAASDAYSFAFEAASVNGPRMSASDAARCTKRRAASSSVRARASFHWIISNSAIGLPNCRRSLAYAVATSSEARPSPIASAPMPIRPRSSTRLTSSNAAPSRPIRSRSDTGHSSRTSCAVSEA